VPDLAPLKDVAVYAFTKKIEEGWRSVALNYRIRPPPERIRVEGKEQGRTFIFSLPVVGKV
jgi:hypothetical protein